MKVGSFSFFLFFFLLSGEFEDFLLEICVEGNSMFIFLNFCKGHIIWERYEPIFFVKVLSFSGTPIKLLKFFGSVSDWLDFWVLFGARLISGSLKRGAKFDRQDIDFERTGRFLAVSVDIFNVTFYTPG